MLTVNLEQEVLGYNQKPFTFQDNSGKVRNMLVRDVLQMSIASLPAKQEYKILSRIYKFMPKLGDSECELVLDDLEDKEFICDAVKQSETIIPTAKAYVIFEVLKKTI